METFSCLNVPAETKLGKSEEDGKGSYDRRKKDREGGSRGEEVAQYFQDYSYRK